MRASYDFKEKSQIESEFLPSLGKFEEEYKTGRNHKEAETLQPKPKKKSELI